MYRDLSDWMSVSGILGVVLILSAVCVGKSGALPHQVPGLEIAGVTGLGLLVLVTVAACWRRQISALLADVPAGAGRSSSRPQVRLFIASFAALFLEVALIRYTGSQLRVFSFFKNVPLIAAYLGLGVGCALGDGRPRHVVSFLLFFVPVVAFLSAGTFVFSGMLGRAAAAATTEHILGDAVVRSAPELLVLGAQVGIGGFCLVTLLGFSSLFVPLGRLLGGAFEQLPRLSAYTINILGSLAGTLVFVLLSYWWMPPWVWMLVGLSPLLWWLDRRRDALFAVGLIALSALTTAPAIGETIWSPYQKLVGQAVKVQPNPSGEAMPGYLVEISDVFYQVAVDLRPAAVARSGQNPYPHYDNAFRVLSRPIQRVLIVGSGTGNDVAAALRAGAMAVDAVDIDPAIVSLGREHHPERPYADPRVRVIVDDARAAFRKLPAGAYDAVLFGLLDSHTQLGMSSVRLDNYVFTRESFAEARRLLRPGGRMVVTAATFRDWFRQRFIDMLSTTCDSPVQTQDAPGGAWVTYDCQINGTGPTELAGSTAALLPTDDWPFLYLPERAIPRAYSLVVVLLAFGCFLVIRGNGLSPARFRIYHAHLFFLGAAFLLMEVYAINRLALLFGTTWTVSAVAVMVVLTLIVAANLTLTGIGSPPYAVAYAGLFGSLIVSYSLGPDAVLGQGVGLAIAYSFAVLLPVYFAGLVFARSFAIAPIAGTAIGANMLGAVVGGWAEYIGMALGIRALLVLAMSFYLGSLVCWRSSKSGPHPT